MATITVTVRLAWWVMPYMNAVARFSELVGLDPDVDKVVSTAMRGVKLSIG